MTHPDGTYADPRALDTPLPETARVPVERPTWGEKAKAIAAGLVTTAVLFLFLFGLPGLLGGL